jgi:hypothetical protein
MEEGARGHREQRVQVDECTWRQCGGGEERERACQRPVWTDQGFSGVMRGTLESPAPPAPNSHRMFPGSAQECGEKGKHLVLMARPLPPATS